MMVMMIEAINLGSACCHTWCGPCAMVEFLIGFFLESFLTVDYFVMYSLSVFETTVFIPLPDSNRESIWTICQPCLFLHLLVCPDRSFYHHISLVA